MNRAIDVVTLAGDEYDNLVDKRDDLIDRIAALEASLQACCNVLAVIHGDGGHYREAHGDQKAADDAIAIYCKLRAEHAAERERREAAETLLRDIATRSDNFDENIDDYFYRYKD